MNCSELGETAPKMGGSTSGSTEDNDPRGNLDPKVKGNTNENNDVTGGSNHTFAYNQPTNLTPTYENDSDSSKPSEDQYDLSNSIDYDVEYLDESEGQLVFQGLSCDDCTADPLSEPGPSKPSKRVSKVGHNIFYWHNCL